MGCRVIVGVYRVDRWGVEDAVNEYDRVIKPLTCTC
jgi:hypothetical protein